VEASAVLPSNKYPAFLICLDLISPCHTALAIASPPTENSVRSAPSYSGALQERRVFFVSIRDLSRKQQDSRAIGLGSRASTALPLSETVTTVQTRGNIHRPYLIYTAGTLIYTKVRCILHSRGVSYLVGQFKAVLVVSYTIYLCQISVSFHPISTSPYPPYPPRPPHPPPRPPPHLPPHPLPHPPYLTQRRLLLPRLW
jgi:hypothetical protein